MILQVFAIIWEPPVDDGMMEVEFVSLWTSDLRCEFAVHEVGDAYKVCLLNVTHRQMSFQ